jgi:hypothetical protein
MEPRYRLRGPKKAQADEAAEEARKNRKQVKLLPLRKEEEVLDEDGDPVLDEDGEPVYESVHEEIGSVVSIEHFDGGDLVTVELGDGSFKSFAASDIEEV